MRRWPAGWAELAGRAERWLLPGACLGCGDPVPTATDPLVCDLCRLRWRAPAPPICPRCGEPLPLRLACRLCVDWPSGFDLVRSAVLLTPRARALVHRLKYGGWRRLADSFARPMAPLMADLGEGDLVPIPLGSRRRRQRGYNQAEELAVAVGRLTGHPVVTHRLQRATETGSQVRLAPEARRANLAGVFAARPSVRPAILVDDVFTTGATLVSAAATLLDAGASRVVAVTFARATAPLAGAAAALTPALHPSFQEAF